MFLGRQAGRVRCLAVWVVATAGLGAVAVAVAARAPLARSDPSLAALRRTPLDVAVTEVAALALVGCTLWMWAATTAVVVEVLRDGTGRVRWSTAVPAGVRRAVLVACGVAVVGGLAHPSYAGGPRAHHSPLWGLPLPDRAVVSGPRVPPLSRDPQVPRTVLVRTGDTLWSLAERDLPPGAPAALITARWRAIYDDNRPLIGPDPDVIVPGQRLRLPGKDPS